MQEKTVKKAIPRVLIAGCTVLVLLFAAYLFLENFHIKKQWDIETAQGILTKQKVNPSC